MPVSQKIRKLSVSAFFGLLLLLGGLLHRDYGVPWDAPNNHLNGLVNIKYVASLLPIGPALRQHSAFATIPDIRNYSDAHHGPVFEIGVVLMNYLLTDHDSRSYFLLRNFLIFSLFLLGVWALYRIGTCWFRDWRWGLLGATLLVLSPRFFAEAFYNGKDIVYMAVFALAMYTLLQLLARPTLGRAVLHGLATALTVDIRVQGLQLILFTVLGLLLGHRFGAPRHAPRQLGPVAGTYFGVAAMGIVAGWPYLWAHSLHELLAVSAHAVRYPWGFNNFYLGEFVPVGLLPWHYIPVWMLVTIPVPYTLAAALGLLGAGRTCLQHGIGAYLRTPEGRTDLLLALWLLAPMLLVMTTNVVVYEGWRHLYFIYPALLLWAVRGLQLLVRSARQHGRARLVARGALTLVLLETGHTVYRMVQMYPYTNVYFSFLPGPAAEQLFERDYWAVSYRQGLEWILAHDTAPVITVNTFWQLPLYNNMLILKPEERARLRYTPGNTARYYLAGYRWHPQSYLDSLGAEVHVIRAGGVRVLSVFKRLPQTPTLNVKPPVNSLAP